MGFDPPYHTTIHYTTLKDLPETHWLYREFKTYLREMPAMLAAGMEGKWVLIHGDEVVAFFDTFPEGSKAGAERFFPHP